MDIMTRDLKGKSYKIKPDKTTIIHARAEDFGYVLVIQKFHRYGTNEFRIIDSPLGEISLEEYGANIVEISDEDYKAAVMEATKWLLWRLHIGTVIKYKKKNIIARLFYPSRYFDNEYL